MNRLSLHIFVLVFGLVGLVFLTVAAVILRSELEFRKSAISAPGTIVDLEPTRSRSGSTSYRPVFEFVDHNDRLHRVAGSVASNPPSYHRGEAVTVLYRPENPEIAHLDSLLEHWFLPLVFGSLGVIFTSIAAGVVAYGVRKRGLRARLDISATQAKRQ